MDETTLGLIIGILGLIVGLPSFIYFLGDRISLLRKWNYLLRNTKFKSKINAIRKYPNFKYDIKELKSKIDEKFIKMGEQIEFQKVSKNYIEIYFKDKQAPYLIKIMPDIDHFETEERINISIKLLGTIDFRYREEIDNKKYLRDIEEFFKVIESLYNINPVYENYNMISTLSGFEEEWNKQERIEDENSVINIGKHVINIYSSSLTHVYDANKKYLINISSI